MHEEVKIMQFGKKSKEVVQYGFRGFKDFEHGERKVLRFKDSEFGSFKVFKGCFFCTV